MVYEYFTEHKREPYFQFTWKLEREEGYKNTNCFEYFPCHNKKIYKKKLMHGSY